MFQKKLEQVHQKNICFVIIGTSWILDLLQTLPHVCNKCLNILMTAYELKNIEILSVKGVVFRCILWGISRDEAVNRLNKSVLDDRSVL